MLNNPHAVTKSVCYKNTRTHTQSTRIKSQKKTGISDIELIKYGIFFKN